jgi:hypothetical protein
MTYAQFLEDRFKITGKLQKAVIHAISQSRADGKHTLKRNNHWDSLLIFSCRSPGAGTNTGLHEINGQVW